MTAVDSFSHENGQCQVEKKLSHQVAAILIMGGNLKI